MWFLWAAPAPLHTAKHAVGSLVDKIAAVNPRDRSLQHRKELDFLQKNIGKKRWRENSKIKQGRSSDLLEGRNGIGGERRRVRCSAFSPEGGGEKQLGFLCGCAPA